MHRLAALLVLLVACGPAVEIYDESITGGDTSATTGVISVSTTESQTTASTTANPTASTAADDTTSTTETTTDGDDDVDSGDTVGFIIAPDGGGICHCECDLWAQDCPDGSRCVPWANDGGDTWNATRCVELDPDPVAVGDTCLAETSGVSGVDDCGIGAMCWGVDPVTLEGTCVAMCSGSEANPQCGEGETCFIAMEGVLVLCLPSCDPLAPDCAPDEACMREADDDFDDDVFVCLPTPPFATLGYGEACTELLTCGSGLACVSSEHVPDCVERCCTTLGDLAQSPTCPDPSQTCIPLDDTMPTEGLCFCGVPP